MATSFLPHDPQGRISLLDNLGYGHRAYAPSQLTVWLVSAAVVFYMGMLPILWRHGLTILPSLAWTSLATVLLWLAALSARHSTITLPRVTACVVTLCLSYPVFGWISYMAWGLKSSEREGIILQTILLMLLAIALYLVGAAARSHRAYKALWATWGTILGYALLNAQALNMQSLYEASIETGIRLNYQLMGDTFAICSAILATRIRQPLWQWIFVGVSLGIMFLIPSRSAAFFGAVALFVALLLFASHRNRLILVSLALFTVLSQQTGMFAQLFEGTRFEAFFTPGSSDNSWDSRQEVMDYGLAVLGDKPFTGEWAFQLSDLKMAGAYMHNALDIWAQTGIVPFLLFLAVWALLLLALVQAWERWPRLAKEAIPVLVFAALSWILARNITNGVLFFCLGFASTTLAQARYGRPHR